VTRVRSEHGFTLPELMVSLVIGMVLVLAAFTLIERSFVVNDEVADRTDSSQRARLAMEQITRQIRSQVCPDASTPAIVGGDEYSFTFYSYTGASDAFDDQPLQPRTLEWDNGSNSIRVTQQGETPPTRTILAETLPPEGTNQPVFQYFTWTSSGQVGVDFANPLPVPLTAQTASEVVLVRVSFLAMPSGRAANATATSSAPPKNSTQLTEDIYMRNADPNNVRGPAGPTC
jgi:prepilin-type N-terminal cleavage/methylation domain-containing protein